MQYLLDQITDNPLIIKTDEGLNGAIYLDAESRFTVSLSSAGEYSMKHLPNQYTGVYSGGYIKIVDPRIASSKNWHNTESVVSQVSLRYKYCLASPNKKVLDTEKISNMTLVFPEIFHINRSLENKNITLDNDKLSIEVNVNVIKPLTILNIKLKDELPVDDIIKLRTRFERFFTSLMGVSVRSEETYFNVDGSQILYLSPNESAKSEATQLDKIARFTPIYGDKHIQPILEYVTNFEKLGHAAHTHATYVEYRQKSIYLDSQLSVLFASVDSVYKKTKHLQKTSKSISSRIELYDNFLNEITDLKSVKSNLKSFLKNERTKEAFVDPLSFQKHLNWVFDFADKVKLDSGVSKRINTLRNDIAHGNDYDFGEFMEEWTDPKDGKKYPAITGKVIDDIANAVWASIQKLAKEE